MPDVTSAFLSSVGFVEGSLAEVAAEMLAWRTEIGMDSRGRVVNGPLAELVARLGPLTTHLRPRELLVEAGAWVAYLDCFVLGSDTSGPVRVLSERLGTRGVTARCVARRIRIGDVTRLPGTEFSYLGPAPGAGAGERVVRVVAAASSGNGRWEFHEVGDALPFEEPQQYRRRRVADRLSTDLVVRYCEALGIRLRDPDGYGPRGQLFETPHPAVPGMREYPLSSVSTVD